MVKSKFIFDLSNVLFYLTMSVVVAFPNPSIYKAIFIIVFFLYTTFQLLLNNKGIGSRLQIGWALAFYIFCKLSSIWSETPWAINEVINNVRWAFMLSISVVNYVRINQLSVIDVAKRMLVIGFVFILNVVLNGTFIEGRYTVIIGNYVLNENVFGQISMGISCYLLYWSKKNNWKTIFINIVAIIMVVLALISGSRKSIISLIIFIIGFTMYEYPPNDILRSIYKIFSVVAVIGLVYVLIMNVNILYNTVGLRIESFLSIFKGEEADGSTITRMKMLEYAKKMFVEKPIFGYGLNTYSHISGFNAYAHNNYMELLANTGLIGFSIYYLPVFIYLITTFSLWKKRTPDSILPLSILIVYIINDFFSVSYFSLVSHVFIGLSIGMMYNLLSFKNKDNKI